jgi:aryl-alcohol dehydrogenase-like predicted oxidoreductase
MRSDPPVIPLFSSSSEQQLRDSLGALDVQLSDEQMQRLNTAGLS